MFIWLETNLLLKFNIMKFSEEAKLIRFIEAIESDLFDVSKITIINYQSSDPEKAEEANMDFLNKISRKGGVYLIFTRNSNTNDWLPIYLGQTKSNYSRQRLRNHLFKKDPRTGSQLENVKDSLLKKHSIGVNFVEIVPEILRHSVEEVLIKKYGNKLNWNKNGR